MGLHIGARMIWTTPEGQGDVGLFQAYLSGLGTKFDDLKPLWIRIARNVLEPTTEMNFETEGDLVGGWEPLSEATLKRRKQRGFTTTILTDTGRLRGSFRHDESEHHEIITSYWMEWGSDVPYAPYHQTGTSRMPARPILFVQDDTVIADIEEVIRGYAEEVLRGVIPGTMEAGTFVAEGPIFS